MTSSGLLRKIIAILLFFTLVFLVGCDEQVEISGEDFSFTDLSGETRQLSEFYGNVIVLDLMGVNCQPCYYQMFELKKISENYSTDEVIILSIDVWVSYGESQQLLEDYLQYFEDEIGIVLDWTFGLDDTNGTIQQQYANEGVPTLLILDQRGNVYYTKVGYESYEELHPVIDEILSSS